MFFDPLLQQDTEVELFNDRMDLQLWHEFLIKIFQTELYSFMDQFIFLTIQGNSCYFLIFYALVC